jgi:SAM-dependent methyltransferase
MELRSRQGVHAVKDSPVTKTYAPAGGPRGQIKTRQRVRDLAEVYTHEREVKAMLDLVPDMFPARSIKAVDMKFLEPACGSGNFLEEILRRKLAGIRFGKVKSADRYEHWLLRALTSIYGVDISADNVEESRQRLIEVVRSHYNNDANTVAPSEGFASAAHAIVATNIVHADFLADASRTEIIDYQPLRGGMFLRVWSMLDDSVEPEPIRDLFHPDPAPKRDEVPIHYTGLAIYPEPTRRPRWSR